MSTDKYRISNTFSSLPPQHWLWIQNDWLDAKPNPFPQIFDEKWKNVSKSQSGGLRFSLKTSSSSDNKRQKSIYLNCRSQHTRKHVLRAKNPIRASGKKQNQFRYVKIAKLQMINFCTSEIPIGAFCFRDSLSHFPALPFVPVYRRKLERQTDR